MTSPNGLAVITGGSSGIGLELAKLAQADGYRLILAADRPFAIAQQELGGAEVETLVTDLSTPAGVDALDHLIGRRDVDVLCANAGHGLAKAFLDQDFVAVRELIMTNIVGTLDITQRVGLRMRSRGQGRILLTGSLAGLMPGACQAAYNASKAFIDSFAYAIRNELKDSGVTVTCLMPGMTESDFWERADALDTKGGSGKKDRASAPAKAGWEALMAGHGSVSPGWMGKLQQAILRVLPPDVLAEMNAKDLKPSAKLQATNDQYRSTS